MNSPTKSDEINQVGYVYRAIATNRDELSDRQVIHWYNQRAEDSENRIKDLKRDFDGDTLPCSDFKRQCTLLSNLRTLLQFVCFDASTVARGAGTSSCDDRAMTVRWRVYAIAAKVVRTRRQRSVKLKEKHRIPLERVLLALEEF